MNDTASRSLIITLTTDFGFRDPYVAAMKGILRTLCPAVLIDDLTHEIPPRNLLEAALFIEQAAPCFPQNAIHVVVVDPGVGTSRLPIVVQAGGQYFVCPDNGLLALYLRTHALEAAHIIENPAYMRPAISATFHGRDVFAPAAAHLANGIPAASFGPPLDTLGLLRIPEAAQLRDGGIQGEVIHVDRFGNCITNIVQAMMPAPAARIVSLPNGLPAAHAATYQSIPEGRPGFLFGSSGRLEIALRNDNAHKALGIGIGAPITVRPA